jgi:hypothetical protein
MHIKLIGFIMGIVFSVGLVAPLFSWGAYIYVFRPRSIDCDILASGGGPPSADTAFLCAVNIKEVGAFCVNPAGGTEQAKGRPFANLSGSLVGTSGGTWVKIRNGLQQNTIVLTNEDIIRVIAIWNAEHLDKVIDLSEINCKPKWTGKFIVTKADAVITGVRIPVGGSAKYLQNTNCRPVTIFKDTPNEQTITVCDFDKEPFKYCSRIPAAVTNGPEFDSGLRVYTGPDGSGTVQSVTNNDFAIKDCILWRDVNKDNAFNLSAFGPYFPDINNIVAPQTGFGDVGGIVALAPFAYYTGECHQHGREQGSTNTFQQLGPQITDINCTGGSQLLDGTYP